MAVTINNREFSQGDLDIIFDELDKRGTRQDVRRIVRRQQGRGVSNDTIRAIRKVHKEVRRSMGYNVKDHGPRDLVDPTTNRLRRLRDLPARRRISPSRRPAPPRVPGLTFQVQGTFLNADGDPRVGNFLVGPDDLSLPSLEAQIAEAGDLLGHTSPVTDQPVNPSGTFRLLGVRSPV